MSALSMAAEVPWGQLCRARRCSEPAYRRGLCAFHAERRRDPLGRRPDILWRRESPEDRDHRLTTLDSLDRLLFPLEEAILAGVIWAPPELVTAYLAYGGAAAWPTPRPMSLALHASILALQESLMRLSLSPIPPEPPAAA